jgi:hypothetical protein
MHPGLHLALRRLAPALVVVAALALTHCAPERARAVREDKSLTLGLPGASFRPTGKISIGTTLGYAHRAKTTINNTETGMGAIDITPDDDSADLDEDERELYTSNVTVSPFVHVYPWDSSAFFFGGGISYSKSNYRFSEERMDSTALAPTYTDVAYDSTSTYVGVPVGWAWIWESGFSLTLDVGPRFRVSRTQEMRDDGEASGVNSQSRDRTVETIDSLENPVTLGGSGIIGWSF